MLQANYFDGRSAKLHRVTVRFEQRDGVYAIVTDAESKPLAECVIQKRDFEENFKGAHRRLHLTSGGTLEFADKQDLLTALNAMGWEDLGSPVQRAQDSWRWVITSVAGLFAFVALMFYIVIPWGSGYVAHWLPASLDKNIGDQAWPLLEKEYFKPSALNAARKKELEEKFAQIARAQGDAPAYRLEFRDSKIGPNAIALPGGTIVFTDALVKLAADNDDGLIGVFAHELGHLKHRHSMRQLVQATATSALISAWLGDVSSIVAAVPSTLASMKFSRDMENESDDYALLALKRAGIDPSATAKLFAKLPSGESSILSTHPGTTERIKRFENKR